MTDDTAALSIDFLVGMTIFILAFIWVVAMIPGLLVGLQAHTIDYDAVAYRTGVILVEDPGEPASWEVAPYGDDWSNDTVERMGLAVSRDDPNILSEDKVNRFFDTTAFTYPDDYRKKVIFGDIPYRFNISFHYITGNELTKYLGDPVPEGYGTIQRLVKVKGTSNLTVNGSDYDDLNGGGYIQGTNQTAIHWVSIVLNNTELNGMGSVVRDPAYQIIPAKDSIKINLIYLNSTMRQNSVETVLMGDDPNPCFDITLKQGAITVSDQLQTIGVNNVTIDEQPVTLTNAITRVQRNVSLLFNITDPLAAERQNINWESSEITVTVNFTLRQNSTTNGACPCPVTNPDCDGGARFLNTTFVNFVPQNPFYYNYTSSRVYQPALRDGVVEVAVW